MRSGKVYLVGAGPGDPWLITERGRRCLAQADVVLYDALVHDDLLRHAPNAELVFVGKRAGRPSERQSAINERIVREAQAGKRVVRLKGGDPLLFARGSEELEALGRAGIEAEVVPGVASPLAAAAYAGIPLTHRELSSSVAFITATESVEKDDSAHDWAKLATAAQTLVLFMGMRKLESILARLVAHGRSPETPAAVVEWASTPRQRVVEGTLATVAGLARDAGLGLPALTIVGDVVRLRAGASWFERKPLFGRRVLVSRAEGQAVALVERLREEGAETVRVPLLSFDMQVHAAAVRGAVETLERYDWVVFTSANAVDAVKVALDALGRDARAFGRARLAAIGPATAERLAALGLRADLVPAVYRGEAVAQGIVDASESSGGLRGKRVLLPRAEVAREVLPESLRAAGAYVDVVPAYRTQGPSVETRAELSRSIAAGELDVVTLTSSSNVEHLVEALGGGASAATSLAGVTLASIGPITTETARRLGLDVHVTADEFTIDGLVDSLIAHFRNRP